MKLIIISYFKDVILANLIRIMEKLIEKEVKCNVESNFEIMSKMVYNFLKFFGKMFMPDCIIIQEILEHPKILNYFLEIISFYFLGGINPYAIPLNKALIFCFKQISTESK